MFFMSGRIRNGVIHTENTEQTYLQAKQLGQELEFLDSFVIRTPTSWLISTQGCPCGTTGNGHVYAYKGYDVDVGIVAGTRALNQNNYYLRHHKSNCLSPLSKKKWKEIKCYLFNNECGFTMPGHEKILNKCII